MTSKMFLLANAHFWLRGKKGMASLVNGRNDLGLLVFMFLQGRHLFDLKQALAEGRLQGVFLTTFRATLFSHTFGSTPTIFIATPDVEVPQSC